MSILKKPYTISVWDDIWNPEAGKFEEKRLGIIGTDNMPYQGRAIEPNLTQNVNGTKKFSFKMYKHFIDNETGERVENPFIDWLVSERKVKLQYKGKWYDFIIKNIKENSSNYLYTYQLEDALVQELSKNGFGVTLDTKLMNNLGTASELADYVLKETDWQVSSSEVFVEKIEDGLVYVTIPSGTVVHKIIDQTELDSGIDDLTTIKLTENWKVLAFYTSCTSKPHRFQFIYIPNGYQTTKNGKTVPSVSTDENQIINVKDCQYYCEIPKPESADGYQQQAGFKQFYLPKGFAITDLGQSGIGDDHDTTISTWYRGYRYGFAQLAKYVPILDKYCQIYEKNGEKYYGFTDNDYNSPTLLQNVITNTEFKGTTGWVSTYDCNNENGEAHKKNEYGFSIEPVYGRFHNSGVGQVFVSAAEELANGKYKPENKYDAYLKITLPAYNAGNKAVLINTGFYDNRTLIGEVDYNEEWYFKPDFVDEYGQNIDVNQFFDFKLQEVSFNSLTGSYQLGKIWAEAPKDDQGKIIVDRLKFNGANVTDDSYADVKVTSNEFKEKEIKLVITPLTDIGNKVCYIKNVELFKLLRNDSGAIIHPGNYDTNGTIKTTYRLLQASYVEGEHKVLDIKDIKYENYDKTELDYATFQPSYNEGAQKIRSVDAKESNYFNILQSIAEKFEVWLELEIGRNEQGGITSKNVRFKNYAGKDNYASFRYGVNLKDIQRTHESKNIVTKLIVKQNSNEHAKNGFCTIARSEANQTGENYIYDFRYYHDIGMLDRAQYVAGLYYSKNIYNEELVEAGPDIAEKPSSSYNLQNYFNRIKNLNIKIQSTNDKIAPQQSQLVKLKAELAVQEGLLEAATQAIEEVTNEFLGVTDTTPENYCQKNIAEITCEIPDEENNWGLKEKDEVSNGEWSQGTTITAEQDGDPDSPVWKFTIIVPRRVDTQQTFYFRPEFTIKYESSYRYPDPLLSCIIEAVEDTELQESTGFVECSIAEDIEELPSSIQSLLTEYATYIEQKNSAEHKIEGYIEEGLKSKISTLEEKIDQDYRYVEQLTEYKTNLNHLFYSCYSRFIQEGTWIDEKYVDDDKYYIDAQSVMYDSCYPQVAYTINVLALSALPGYEAFGFELGDKTYVIDPEFFGKKSQEEVTISEVIENLDDPGKNQIKVQNFKNQFQDLFQKITATVQQTQYSTGSYKKAVALAEASAAVKSEFLLDAFNEANNRLSNAGQTTVEWGDDGITLTDSATKDQMRMIGGAILMSTQDEDGQRKWKTGLTPDGISASLVTAGTVDTGKVQIKNGNDITFLWNAFGISAFDVSWHSGAITGVPKTSKFVRFDKYGIYGMDISAKGEKDGLSWAPKNIEEINSSSTFALTWEGLKVTGSNGVVAKIGKDANNIIKISRPATEQEKAETNNDITSLFEVTNDGNLNVKCNITGSNITGSSIYGSYIEGTTIQGATMTASTFTGNDFVGANIIGSTFSDVAEPATPNIYLSNTALSEQTIGEKTGLSLICKIGEKFGVDVNGTLYANSGYIGNLQIESIPKEGYMASSVDTNQFSWKFSQSEGMFMWNGNQQDATTDDPTRGSLFAIYNVGSLSVPKYILSMKGHIQAESGQIGGTDGWSIGPGKITAGTLGTDGFHMYSSQHPSGSHFGATNDVTWAIGIGNNFGVSKTGIIYAKEIQCNGGSGEAIEAVHTPKNLETGNDKTYRYTFKVPGTVHSASTIIKQVHGSYTVTATTSYSQGQITVDFVSSSQRVQFTAEIIYTYVPLRTVFSVKDGVANFLAGKIGVWSINSEYPLTGPMSNSQSIYTNSERTPSNFYGDDPGAAICVFLSPYGLHVKPVGYLSEPYCDDRVSWAAVVQCVMDFMNSKHPNYVLDYEKNLN